MKRSLAVASNERPGPAEAALPEDRLLTTREVADYLGLSKDAVLRRWRAGDLPGFRLSPNLLRFRASEIEAWLHGQRGGDAPRRVA